MGKEEQNLNNAEKPKLGIFDVMLRFFIRSFTNDKERAKQYFMVAKSENYSEALIIRKLVLSENLELYGGNSKIIKKFKDYYLFEQRFSIKIETLKMVMSVLNGA